MMKIYTPIGNMLPQAGGREGEGGRGGGRGREGKGSHRAPATCTPRDGRKGKGREVKGREVKGSEGK